ncbi:acyl-homoserine lactone acylase PvdQ [Pontibacter ummariensis]|uniref:Acyl-homoserine lactone (AHL) acylase PvdQ n=1 Tax=Pontibacter ummariensis TaxID=1610492 RepID=A0A239HZJ9_9BACT|nr:acylase [Pontibacter ummariensis]PRY10149.1 acyl-homoserine lactone acylase PvdQ [Pontibacter ummariensis]SNS86946.1 Acyl-homoserine lactone (AHL) acylase PvdQ [Pontibacter ummariensis]
MRYAFKNATLVFLFVSLFSSCALKQATDSAAEVAQWEEQAARVTIVRDDFGVPHVYGKTDADAVFGLLYAQCEDDFNRVERNYLWAIGRLAEVEGEEMLYSDLRARLYMTEEEAIAQYEKSPEWLKELCRAFADGINYYLYTHPEVKPKLLTHFEPWMPMYFSEGSIGGDIESVSTKRIQAFYEENKSLGLNSYGHSLVQPGLLEEPKGSNGFSISGQHTASGKAMLLINPHTSFFFRGEVHAVSEEGLNAYGAVTWGQFFVYQGFNEKTGWMHTSAYADVIDEFEETIVEQEGKLFYKYGEELRPVSTNEVTLSYKEGDEIKQKTFTTYRTHHGPITHKNGDKWVATALMWKPSEALIQSYTRTKKRNLQEFDEMMQLRTNSSNATVYADADGNIAYYHGNFFPRRDTAFDYSKPVDGSNPKTDWNGLHPVEETIRLVNPPNGWIQNCNSTPFTSAAEYSPKQEDYPVYMAPSPENFRGVHAIRLLQKANNLTLDKLIQLAYDPYLPGFEVLIPGLVKAYDKQKPNDPKLQEAINVLRRWDYAVSKESVAMSLAHFYAINSLRNGSAPKGLSLMERFDHYTKVSPEEERLALFRQTLAQLEEDFGQWNTPWGEINRYQRLSGDIQQAFNDTLPSIPVGLASGNWGALASYGANAYNTKRLYGTSGNSFVAVVEFGDKVKAKTLLAGGQSGDPASPHFADQAQRYADVQFKDVAYYREDVEKRAKATYHPGEAANK